MRKPTKTEVTQYIQVVNMFKQKPKTEVGMLRVVAKYFHCTSKEIANILSQEQE